MLLRGKLELLIEDVYAGAAEDMRDSLPCALRGGRGLRAGERLGHRVSSCGREEEVEASLAARQARR